jgi:hypothetical protein
MSMTAVTVTNTEADVAGITVTPGNLTTSESGTTASFGVSLTSQPIAPVIITLVNGNPGQGSLSQSTLILDATNWNVIHKVVVTGLDDHVISGDQTYQITGSASSGDGNYNGQTLTPVTVTNTEADVAGILVAPSSLTIVAATPSTFTVALTSQPSAAVTINLASTDPAHGVLSLSTLTFTSANWNQPQAVNVYSPSSVAGSGSNFQVSGLAASSDINFNNVAMPPVSVTAAATSPVSNAPAATQTTAAAVFYTTYGITNAVSPAANPLAVVSPSAVAFTRDPSASTAGLVAVMKTLPSTNADVRAFYLSPGGAASMQQSSFGSLSSFGLLVTSYGSSVSMPAAKAILPMIAAAVPPSLATANQPTAPDDWQDIALSQRTPFAPTQAVLTLGTGAPVLEDPLDVPSGFDPQDDSGHRSNVLLTTGLLASAGYVLFNTRAGLALLSVLASRPLWKQFDPLEILYAWDGQLEKEDRDERTGESLVSLVE